MSNAELYTLIFNRKQAGLHIMLTSQLKILCIETNKTVNLQVLCVLKISKIRKKYTHALRAHCYILKDQ